MPGGITRDNLPIHKSGGDRIRAPEFNAIAMALRPNQSARQGLSAQGELLARDPPRARDKYQWCYAAEAIPAYSILAVQGNVIYPASDPVRFQSAKWGLNGGGSPLVFFTNDSLAISSCAWGNVRPINDYDTALINWAGSASPVVGMWCGPSLDAYTVEAGRFGFVVLGIEGSQVRIMRTDEPHAVVGVVTETITPFDPCSRQLGKGKIRIEYRSNEDDELKDAGSPLATSVPSDCSGEGELGSGSGAAGEGFEVEVFNPKERTLPASDCYRVLAVNTLGVGLVVIDTVGEPPPTECCSSSGSQPSESSSSGSDSGSGEGGEGLGACNYWTWCIDEWIHRSGPDPESEPPPVDGRFEGETVIVCACTGPIPVCGDCLWARSFAVDIFNVIDGTCNSCDDVTTSTVTVNYNGTYFYAPYSTTFHWWRAENIWDSADCGGVFSGRSLNIFIGDHPSFGCFAIGVIIANDNTNYIPSDNAELGSEFAMQCGRALGTPCEDPIVMRISTADQFEFGACNLSTIPIDVMSFSPYAP